MTELGPEDEKLLEAARGGLEPTSADRARNKRALFAQLGLGVGAGAGATATAASTASAATTTAAATTGAGVGSMLVKAIVALSIVGGVAAGGAVALRRDDPPAIPSPNAIVSPTIVSPTIVSSPPRATALPTPNAPLAEPLHAEAKIADPPTPPRRSPSTLAAPAQPPAPAPPALDGETRLLREADGRLRAGDGAGALVLLDRHEAQFPNAVLAEEREGERVLALCALGRVAEARARAARFLASSPRSPVAPRVKSSCAGDSTR